MSDNLLEQEIPSEAVQNPPQKIHSDKPAIPQGLPEKFWNPETQEIRVDALLKSYLALETKLSQSVNDCPACPDSPDAYDIKTDHGLFTPDGDINARLHGKGLSNDQVQEVYDLAAEKMVPLIVQMAQEFQADREVERLVEHFGGQQQWKEVSRQLLAFGKQNLPTDVLDGLSGSYDGILALYRMMQNEEPDVSGNGQAVSGTVTEDDLHTMMRDPKYWRDRDSSHVRKVTEGFRSLYGSNG